MEIEEPAERVLKNLRIRLDRFAREFDGCIKSAPTRRHLRTYLAGQQSGLMRKSVEPMALAAEVAPRTLQEFLSLHRWDHEEMRRRVQEIVIQRHADDAAIALIDETSFPKKGEQTAGVQRQYCGATGKTDNCVVTVQLGYVVPGFQALLDGDLYLPEESWHADRERCRKAGIPDDVVYRPKWQIALDLLDRAQGHGVRMKYLTADELYGGCHAFRKGVQDRGLTYVVEVPRSVHGWTKRPAVIRPGATALAGRPRQKAGLAPGAPAARRVEKMWKRGGPSWKTYYIKDTEKGPVVWEARVSRFWSYDEGVPAEEGWLVIARNVLDGEVKYFLSNASENTPIETLLHVAFSRAHVEYLFQIAKSEIGMDHFEVRGYLPLMRHLILSFVSLLFLAEQTERLRGEKPVVEPLSGQGRHRGAA
jgi:SRSO17 transposase